MTLAPGQRLGPYEILAPVGAGGMGEVYRARDTRLERTVAIKVLPAHRSASPEVRQRFDREARTISQLSHPHICALHDVGREGEIDYLVMEFLEGETLADRLGRGALPQDQALRFGVEIADALEKAHRQGIVHRDLKPGNVMLTPSGVKVLDFGLAKALSPGSPAAALTALPTETPLTEQGTLLGTLQYMAPEQLEGKNADARTDIFALGLVLYEMATGEKAFTGASRASLIGAILRDDPPPVSRLSPLSPRALDRVVSTCLAKEPEERWQTARDVALQLEGIRRDRSAGEPAGPRPVAPRRRAGILPWAVAAAAAAVALALSFRAGIERSPRPSIVRTFLIPPPGTTFHVSGANRGGVVVSPDGRRIAFGAREPDGPPRLWVRELASLEAYPVAGSEGALFPFWSPDSRSIGFFASGKLKVVEASPSSPPPRELADVVEARGGTWGEGGTILFSPGNFRPLMKVAAAGGAPVEATQLDPVAHETSHRWPYFLPGGRRFLFDIRKPDPSAPTELSHAIYVGSLDSAERHQVLGDDTSAAYVPPGYLLFRRRNNLMAVPFDQKSLAARGEPVVLAENIQGFAATGASLFSASENLLVYSPLVEASFAKMVLLDRTGREVSAVGPPGRFVQAGLSADGHAAVASQIEDPQPPDLWAFDTAVGRGIRLTRDAIAQVNPVFSADGKRIFHSAYSLGPWDIWEVPTQGGGAPKVFLQSPTTKTACDVSPDGLYLLYREFNPGTRGDLKYVPVNGERTPRTFVATTDDESNGDFSPDGRWVAYASDESGRKEIYAASFPEPTRRFRVSSEGGAQPRWSRDGKELFYVRSGKLVATAVGHRGDDLTFGESRVLFPFPLFTTIDPGFDVVTRYDVTADGRFFALLRAGEDVPKPLVLVQNWAEAMKGK